MELVVDAIDLSSMQPYHDFALKIHQSSSQQPRDILLLP